ncbi:MAG: alpha/beta fold hydrolase [Thermodesulfobacteriota bacterium]
MKYDNPFYKSNGFRPALILLALLIIAPWVFSGSYTRHVFVLGFVYAIVASNWDLSLGYGGIFNFAHVSFFASGIYTYGLLTKAAGLSPWLALPAGGLTAGLMAVILALPTLRLSGIYVILVTIAFSQLLFQLIISQSSITGGTMGMVSLPSLKIGSYNFIKNGKIGYYYLALALVLLSTAYLHLLIKSRIGRSIIALRDHKYYAVSRGVSQARQRVITLAASALFTGIAGSFFGSYVRVASPDTFGLSTLTLILSILLLGGMATLWGSLVSAILLTFFAEAFAGLGPWRNIIIAGAIVIVLIFYPGGLWAALQELREVAATRWSGFKAAWRRSRGKTWREHHLGAGEEMISTSHGLVAVADTGGHKSPLVLIHGNSSCKEVFFHQFRKFSESHRLLAFDLPGHGVSENSRMPDVTYDIAVYADVAKEIFNKKGIINPVVLGWSLGGYVALELNAQNLPLAGLIICGTSPLGRLPDDLDAGYYATEHMELTSRLFFTPREARQYAEATVGPPNPETKFLHHAVCRTDGRARAFVLSKTLTVDWPRQLHALKTRPTPVAIINGGDDPFINQNYIAGLSYANLWENKVHKIENGGHAPFLLRPDSFNRELERFLFEVKGPRTRVLEDGPAAAETETVAVCGGKKSTTRPPSCSASPENDRRKRISDGFE